MLTPYLLAHALSGGGLPSPDLSDAVLERIEQVVSAEFEEQSLDGLSLIAARQGDVVLRRGWGYADTGGREPADERSSFRAGSLHAQWIAVLVLQLVDEGRLELDQAIGTVLPELGEEKGAVTVGQLLAHTSGVPAWHELWLESETARTPTREEAERRLAEVPLESEPGHCFALSDTNVLLLGWIAERVTEESLDSLIEERLLGPLDLADTLYCDDGPPLDDRSVPYALTVGERRVETAALERQVAQQLCSTAEDVLAWHTGLADGSLLRSATLERMLEPTLLETGELVDAGLGVTLSELGGTDRVTYGGGLAGGHAWVAWYPDEELTVVVLARGTSARLQDVERGVTRALLDLPEPRRTDLRTTSDQRRTYVGQYHTGCDLVLVAEDGDHLVLQAAGWEDVVLLFQGGHRFVGADSEVVLDFVVEDGRATAFTLTGGGSDFTARRSS